MNTSLGLRQLDKHKKLFQKIKTLIPPQGTLRLVLLCESVTADISANKYLTNQKRAPVTVCRQARHVSPIKEQSH